jgi:transposase InsO family protein
VSQKFQFVAAQASEYPVMLLCTVLGVSRSGYYAWRTRPQSQRQRQDCLLAVQIAAIFRASRQSYGSPRVRAELRAQGVPCAAKRVARLMRQAGLSARRARRRVRTTTADPALAVAANLLNRDFSASAPNQKWLADITYLPTQEGWSYVAVVLDLFSRRVIGWAMRATLERDVVISALKQALQQRRPIHDLLHHSDRGSQYASLEYQQQLAGAGIGCSMSRRGICWDNAPMESFFTQRVPALKSELGQQVYASRAAACSAVLDYIERFYNRQRRHSALGYLSPVVYEQQYRDQQSAA